MGYNPILCDLKSHLVIQKLTHMQQCKNPSPKHKKPKHLYNKKKTAKQKPCSESLDVMYHSRYFYVMCYECGDNDGYRR